MNLSIIIILASISAAALIILLILLLLKNREQKIMLQASQEADKIDRMCASGKISQSEATELKKAVGVHGRYEGRSPSADTCMSNKDIMGAARNALHGKWMKYALYMLIFFIPYQWCPVKDG